MKLSGFAKVLRSIFDMSSTERQTLKSLEETCLEDLSRWDSFLDVAEVYELFDDGSRQ